MFLMSRHSSAKCLFTPTIMVGWYWIVGASCLLSIDIGLLQSHPIFKEPAVLKSLNKISFTIRNLNIRCVYAHSPSHLRLSFYPSLRTIIICGSCSRKINQVTISHCPKLEYVEVGNDLDYGASNLIEKHKDGGWCIENCRRLNYICFSDFCFHKYSYFTLRSRSDCPVWCRFTVFTNTNNGGSVFFLTLTCHYQLCVWK